MKFKNLFLMAGALLSAASMFALDITVQKERCDNLNKQKASLLREQENLQDSFESRLNPEQKRQLQRLEQRKKELEQRKKELEKQQGNTQRFQAEIDETQQRISQLDTATNSPAQAAQLHRLSQELDRNDALLKRYKCS